MTNCNVCFDRFLNEPADSVIQPSVGMFTFYEMGYCIAFNAHFVPVIA